MSFFRNHIEKKHPDDYAAYTLTERADLAVFDPIVADRLYSRVIGSSTTSFRQATSPELTDFVKYLNPVYKLPSRGTLTSNIQEEAARGKVLVQALLTNAPLVIFEI